MINSYDHEPAGGKIECDFSLAESHEPAGGKIECDFSFAESHEPAGGKIECDFSFAKSHEAVLISCSLCIWFLQNKNIV